MIDVWLMCQGRQERLACLNGMPKQLLTVATKGFANPQPVSIAERTLDLLDDLCGIVGLEHRATAVVPATPRWQHFADVSGVNQHALLDPGRCIVEGITRLPLLSSSARTLILLGDVVWSRLDLMRVLVDPRPLFFAGTRQLDASGGELFALSCAPELMPEVLATARKTCQHDLAMPGQPGHLRQLLWAIQRDRALKNGDYYQKDPHHFWAPRPGPEASPYLYLMLEDWTKDIDTPQDLETELPRLRELIEAEDDRVSFV